MNNQRIIHSNKNGCRIKTFWFDLGNVILPFDFTPAFQRLSQYAAVSPKKVRGFFEERPWLEADCDEGRVHGYALYRLLKKSFDLNGLTYHRFKLIWNDIFAENRQVSSMIRKLRAQGYRMILISNTNKLHFDYLRKEYPILRSFHRHILSYELKTRKPVRRIYHAALKVSRAKASEVFYTDDRREFIQAATQDHGVTSHVFRTARGLKNALRKHGLKL